MTPSVLKHNNNVIFSSFLFSLHQYPYDIPSEAFPFEIFKQAFAAIQSCVVHLQGVSLAHRFALVPIGPPLLAYKSNCRAMLTDVDGVVELVVDRVYKAGDPIVAWCGPQPNSKLLLNYGFVDDDNPLHQIPNILYIKKREWWFKRMGNNQYKPFVLLQERKKKRFLICFLI